MQSKDSFSTKVNPLHSNFFSSSATLYSFLVSCAHLAKYLFVTSKRFLNGFVRNVELLFITMNRVASRCQISPCMVSFKATGNNVRPTTIRLCKIIKSICLFICGASWKIKPFRNAVFLRDLLLNRQFSLWIMLPLSSLLFFLLPYVLVRITNIIVFN